MTSLFDLAFRRFREEDMYVRTAHPGAIDARDDARLFDREEAHHRAGDRNQGRNQRFSGNQS